MSKNEKRANEILLNKQREFLIEYPVLTSKPFFTSKEIIEKSEIYDILRKMPKGAHLHYHSGAAFDVALVLELTKEDVVYYNEKENVLMAFSNEQPLPGYKKCNDIRKLWDKNPNFDDFLRKKLVLTTEEISSQDSSEIWKHFGQKFRLTSKLIRYPKFYKQILFDIFDRAVADKVYVVELKIRLGAIFENIDEELQFYKDLSTEYCSEVDGFYIRYIVASYKDTEMAMAKSQLTLYKKAREFSNIFVGFDLVNEEDASPPLDCFKEILMNEKTEGFEMFVHAGESASRWNNNLYDAILLGTKRIGHGLSALHHPVLIEESKKRNIAYEVSPISNFILGYTLDLRWHPARFLMANGVEVTISSDGPSFWDYTALTLDF
jgi:adenosine deaminase CECR1